MRTVTLGVVAAVALAPIAFGQLSVTLSPKTAEAFDDYRKKTEASMTWQPRFADLRPDRPKVEPTHHSPTVDVPAGLIHDWVGAIIVENATVAQAVATLQDYAAYQKIYAPDVIESKLLKQDGPHRFHVFLKVLKKKILTAVLHSEYDVEYRRQSDALWTVTSRSTRMVELDGKKESPEGTGYGFLWRLNAYWIIQQKGTSVYLECRSISLTRDIPYGTGFIVRPFVTSLPMESLNSTLRQTAQAIKKR